ncbi:MAG: ATP-binding protein [Myxococcales bacterium]|nr:ATP-binding protein [Myxococcales bacterium]
MTPLRGLGWFAESERDVFFGRERGREELATLVTSQGYRAGLLYGETGVGKTLLLWAGLQPDLRDHYASGGD